MVKSLVFQILVSKDFIINLVVVSKMLVYAKMVTQNLVLDVRITELTSVTLAKTVFI